MGGGYLTNLGNYKQIWDQNHFFLINTKLFGFDLQKKEKKQQMGLRLYLDGQLQKDGGGGMGLGLTQIPAL